MTSEYLFYKRKIINGKNLEIIFHKEYTYMFNQDKYPVVRYLLNNCEDLTNVKFEHIEDCTDGITIGMGKIDSKMFLEITDFGGDITKIICESVTEEESEYTKEDFIDLILEYIKQRDSEIDHSNLLNAKIEKLNQYLVHELDIADRKLKQASWITGGKKDILNLKI